ncbi:hypothetical protein E1162_16940 [Rhodobacteraceae bacterium RKSG542]|uniref:hypothetical protein n=1 Tax=Pseudovibrio flavus TaxID=2529854 RepID=UPI0012BD5893|nr:hypothetical protein [Pseudovibrio flavus]MTI18932.1 hypothetical protein [Pseudovibrio flavus]
MKNKKLIATVMLAAVVAACARPPSTNYLEQRLIPKSGRVHPTVAGTQYDCKIAAARFGPENVWQANVGGRVFDYDSPYNVSTVACFETQVDCEAYLYLMNGYLDQIITSRCHLGRQKGLFG